MWQSLGFNDSDFEAWEIYCHYTLNEIIKPEGSE